MQRILGLSALGLLVFVGVSPAQQPSTGAGPSSSPVVQSGTQGGYTTGTASSSRRFGRLRGASTSDGGSRYSSRRSNRSGSPVVSTGTDNTTSQAVVQASATTPTVESKTVTKTETSGTKSQTVAADANPTVVQPSAMPTGRSGSRGGFLSRLGSRMGR